MNIDIVYARNVDHPFPVLAWLIMIFQKMNPFGEKSFNHMAIRYRKQNGEVWYFDATGKHGVKHRRDFDFLKTYKIIEVDRLFIPANVVSFGNFIGAHNGKKYDKLNVFGLMLKNMLNFVTFNTLGHNQRKIVCSELVVLLLVEFCKVKVKDSDNWDLNDTRRLVKRRVHGNISAT